MNFAAWGTPPPIMRGPNRRITTNYTGDAWVDWVNTTPSSGVEVIADSEGLGGTTSLQLPYNAGNAVCDITMSGLDMSACSAIYLKVSKTGTTRSNLRIYITSDDFAHYAQCDFVINPGITTFAPHLRSFHPQSGFDWDDHGKTITKIRIKDTPGIQSTPYPGMVEGESIRVGPIRLNPKTRPRFLIFTDDGMAGNVVNGANYPAGYPSTGGNHLAIISHYNLKATAAIIPSLVGTASYLTTTQIDTLVAAGWDIVTHSNVGTGSGLKDLETYAAALGEIEDNIADLETLGYSQTSHYYVLPQGGYDSFVWDALLDAGVTAIRMIGDTSPHTIPIGNQAGDKLNDIQVWTPTILPLIESSIQLDGTKTLAQVKAYVEELIDQGCTGSCYIHGSSAAAETMLDGLCYFLRLRQQQGLIDVLTMSEWASAVTGASAWIWNDGTSIDWNSGESIDTN